ncbi:hypothetical protein GCM10009863_30430 [Streptomyces axinellae]|uniref:Uncharacterized protein n=1 Tax=Streptomyces axinellae TaxID=552788 RepID=A0ABN3Q6Z1_9ACTN
MISTAENGANAGVCATMTSWAMNKATVPGITGRTDGGKQRAPKDRLTPGAVTGRVRWCEVAQRDRVTWRRVFGAGVGPRGVGK